MEEATRDKQSSTSGSKRNKQQKQGWIRIHSDETMKSPPVEEPLNTEAQLGEVRKEIREAIEGSERKIRKEIREAVAGTQETPE